MANLIDKTFFQYPLDIPNVDSIVGESLNKVMVGVLEPEILTLLLGSTLYSQFVAGIAVLPTPDAKWTNLKNGTGSWKGLVVINGTAKTALSAYYVYYKYKEDEATKATGITEEKPKPEGGQAVNSMDKMVGAWNRLVDWACELHKFLDANRATYPDWDECGFRYMEKKNTLDL